MRRFSTSVILAGAGILALAAALRVDAMAIMIQPGPAKITGADVIVVGQVVSIEDKDVEAKPNPGALNKVKYRIAVLQVTDNLKGDAKKKMVRVGFIPPVQVGPGGVLPGGGKIQPGLLPVNPAPAVQPIQGAVQPIQIQGVAQPVVAQPAIAQPAIAFPPIKRPGFGNVQLTVGMSGLFFLQKHEAGFYTLPNFQYFVSAENKENLDREVANTRTILKVLDNPMAGLKSDKADKRLETASVLIELYRTAPFGMASKQQPINAEESKLILKALSDADWDQTKYQGNNFQKNPLNLFYRLNVDAKDGFQMPIGKPFTNVDAANLAKAWVQKNWQTYRIQKFVATNTPAGPGGGPIGPGGGPIKILPQPVPPGGIQIQPAPGGIQVQPFPGNVEIQIFPAPPAAGGNQVQPAAPPGR